MPHILYFSLRSSSRLAAVLLCCLVSATVTAGALGPRIGMLHWVGGNQLSRTDTDGEDYVVLASGLQEPDGLTIDLLNNTVYWTNMSLRGPGGSLQRLRLDGSPVVDGEEFLVSPGTFRVGKEIELDPRDGKLYWADRDGMHVMRANVDGSGVESVLHQFTDEQGRMVPLQNPVGIALDLERRQVYITDRFMGTILRFSMDLPAGQTSGNRSDVEILVRPRSKDDRPIDIDLDLANGLMYWTDRGVHQVLRARLDGSQVEVLVDQGKAEIADPIGMSLDLARRKMYWSDMTTHRIHRANLDGSQIEDLIGGEDILNGVPYGPLGVSYVALQPEQGPVAGGNQVAVLGAHFMPGQTTVRLGEGEAIQATVVNENLLTFTAPAGEAGPVSLTVTTSRGSSVLANAYRYR